MFSVEQLVCNRLYDSLGEKAVIANSLLPSLDDAYPSDDVLSFVDEHFADLRASCTKVRSRPWLQFVDANEHDFRLIIGFQNSFRLAVFEGLLPPKLFTSFHYGEKFFRDWDQFSVFCQLCMGIDDYGPVSPSFHEIVGRPMRILISNAVNVFDILETQRCSTILVDEKET